tara:strand:- start:1126 stop:1350 length:225 start_codon:yes stop_codon:yes gene_type:complete
MDRTGQTDLLQSISHRGNQSVGKMPSMNVYVTEITTVNFGGTFVMDEGHVLFLLMMLAVVMTLALNVVVQGFIG